MTLVSHGPLGGERDLKGEDPTLARRRPLAHDAELPGDRLLHAYDAERIAGEIKKARLSRTSASSA